jgi:flagellar hook-basal body complex protein FliE
MQKVGSISDEATKSVENFLSGEGEDLHKTMLATQRADLAGELFLQVRNKVVAAYQEVMRMQV